jgi:indolepyruvate ferredoxin oxidoreductase
MSLQPVNEFGQKIAIHQSSCNKDYSCMLGDCPSFVTVNLKPGTDPGRNRPAISSEELAVPEELIVPVKKDGPPFSCWYRAGQEW